MILSKSQILERIKQDMISEYKDLDLRINDSCFKYNI